MYWWHIIVEICGNPWFLKWFILRLGLIQMTMFLKLKLGSVSSRVLHQFDDDAIHLFGVKTQNHVSHGYKRVPRGMNADAAFHHLRLYIFLLLLLLLLLPQHCNSLWHLSKCCQHSFLQYSCCFLIKVFLRCNSFKYLSNCTCSSVLASYIC